MDRCDLESGWDARRSLARTAARAGATTAIEAADRYAHDGGPKSSRYGHPFEEVMLTPIGSALR